VGGGHLGIIAIFQGLDHFLNLDGNCWNLKGELVGFFQRDLIK
jgi:hypothetical protein